MSVDGHAIWTNLARFLDQASSRSERDESPAPNAALILPDAEARLKKYDEAIAMVEKAAPLNPLYDDVARLRIVRAHPRAVNPAVKAGNFAKACRSFKAFDNGEV